MKDITELALSSLGKELTYQGRIQKEEYEREVKSNVKNTLTIEKAKDKLKNLKK